MGSAKDLGMEIIDNIEIKEVDKSIMSYTVLTCADSYSNLCRFDGIRYGYDKQDIENIEHKNIEDMYHNNRTNIFGEEVTRRMLIGEYVLRGENYEKYFIKASKMRQYFCDQFKKVFEKVDALILPTTLKNVGKISETSNVIENYLNDALTSFANLIGAPGISVPTHKCSQGYPFGMQIVAKPGNDAKMMQIANAIDRLYNNR